MEWESELRRDGVLECARYVVGRFRVFRLHPAEPAGKPPNVGVYWKHLPVERVNHHAPRALKANARKAAEVRLDVGVRHPTKWIEGIAAEVSPYALQDPLHLSGAFDGQPGGT